MDDGGELGALVEGYARSCDARDVEGFRALFADDATLQVIEPDGQARRPLVGIDAIAQIPERLGRYERTRHLVSDHRVSDGGDDGEATGRAACEAHHHLDGTDTVMHITYLDRYRRTDVGWRIAERTVRIDRLEERPIDEEEGG